MANTLVIDWKNLESFTIVPMEISSICKYNGKKLSMDHKIIYSYLAKLDVDNKLNNSGYASFDKMMQRFGYGSKGSLTGYILHLIDVGLLSKSETKKGQRNIYTVHPIDLDKVSYGAKSHIADSNKNKLANQKIEPSTSDTPPEMQKSHKHEFMNNKFVQERIKRWEDEPNKQRCFKGYVWHEFTVKDLKVTAHDFGEWLKDWESKQQNVAINNTPVQQRVFTPSNYVDERDQAAYVENDNFDYPEQSTTDKSKLERFLDHGVVDDIPPNYGIGWFASPLSKNELDSETTIKYLSILHQRGLWDQYNPDQQVVNSLYSVLSKKSISSEDTTQNYGFEDDPMFIDFVSGKSEIPF